MTTVTHAKVSAKSDGGDATLVRPSDWNADHIFTGLVSSSSLVLLETKTASSSATLDFTTAITSTYDEYQIEFINVQPATNTVDLLMRVSTNGGSSYDSGSNYHDLGFVFRAGGSASNGATTTSISMNGAQNGTHINTASGIGLSGTARLINPGNGSIYPVVLASTFYYDQEPYYMGTETRGVHLSTTAVNAFRFLMSSGNIASGTIRIYGIAKTSNLGGTPATNAAALITAYTLFR